MSITPISTTEVDELAALEFNDSLAIALYRGIVLRHPPSLLSLLVTELGMLGLLVIVLLPMPLIALQTAGLLSTRVTDTIPLLLVLFGFAVALLLIWNRWLWIRAKSMKTLAHLLPEVDRFNRTVHMLIWLEETPGLPPTQPPTPHTVNLDTDETAMRTEAIAWLQTTRDHVVRALRTAHLRRQNPTFRQLDSELGIILETTLTSMMSLEINTADTRYYPIFNDALQINLNLHRLMVR